MPVNKRENKPELPVRELPRDVMFIVGDKEYPLPHLSLKQYKKYLKVLDKIGDADAVEKMTEIEQLEATKDIWFELLKIENPEIKKADLDDMPLYQYGMEFYFKVKQGLFRVPLHG